MKKKTKAEMVTMLKGLRGALSEYQKDFPALVGVCSVMNLAIKDPTQAIHEKPAKAAEAKPLKPVTITYQGEDIVVKDTPFMVPGFEWPKFVFARIKGVLTNKVYTEGKHEGEPIFKSAWDSKAKAFVLPKDKKPEVVAYLTMLGCPIVEA